jgi:hypothetical protein
MYHEKKAEDVSSPREMTIGQVDIGVECQRNAGSMEGASPGIREQGAVHWGGQDRKCSRKHGGGEKAGRTGRSSGKHFFRLLFRFDRPQLSLTFPFTSSAQAPCTCLLLLLLSKDEGRGFRSQLTLWPFTPNRRPLIFACPLACAHTPTLARPTHLWDKMITIRHPRRSNSSTTNLRLAVCTYASGAK